MRVRLLMAVTTVCALGAAGNAWAATTFYVAPSGAGVACSAAQPCSLTQANTDSVDGDTLMFAAGTYVNPHIAHGVTVTGTGRPTLRVGTLTFDSAAGNFLRDVIVTGDGNEVLHAAGITLDRVLVTDEGGVPTAICALSTAIVRDSECLANGNAVALTVTGTSELRNVTAASVAGDAIKITGAPTVLIHNTIAAAAAVGARDLVSTEAGAHITVDHTRWTNVSYLLPTNPFTFAEGNTSPSLASMWATFGGEPIGGSLTIDGGRADVGDGSTDLGGNPRTGAAPDIGAYEYQPSAPAVVTGDPTVVGTNSATVAGSIDPHGLSTTWRLLWGTTTAYENPPVEAAAPLTGSAPVSVTTELSGLDENTTYHYRYVGTNDFGPVVGVDKTFTTFIHPAGPTPIPQPAPKPKVKPKVTITLPPATHCRATRTLSLKPKIAKGGTITAVSVYVKGKRIKRVTGTRARRTIKLTKLPRGTYMLEVRVTTKDGRTIKRRQRYHTCR